MRKGLAALFALAAMILFQTEISYPQCTIKEARRNDSGSAPKTAEASFDLAIDSVSLSDVSIDHLDLKLALRFVASKEAQVRRITFANLKLNDLPVYAAPIAEPNRFTGGQWLALSRPLILTIYYRDLESLHPLEILLSENRVHVEGTLYADLELNLLQKAMLFSRSTRMPISFKTDAAFEVPGGPATRALALRMVRSAAKTMGQIKSGLESAANKLSSWRQDLWQVYAPSVLLGYVRLRLINPGGEAQQVECSSAGFRISADQFVMQRSLLEPWRADPQIAAAMERENFTIEKDSYDFWVWPADAKLRTTDHQLDSSSAFSLSKEQVRIVHQSREETESFLVLKGEGRPRKIRALKREAPSNVVLLEFTDPAGRMPGFKSKLRPDSRKFNRDEIALFRFAGGIEADQAKPQLIFMNGKRDGVRIRLDGQVDRNAWGSPLISREGVVGMLQNEKTGITLGSAFKALK